MHHGHHCPFSISLQREEVIQYYLYLGSCNDMYTMYVIVVVVELLLFGVGLLAGGSALQRQALRFRLACVRGAVSITRARILLGQVGQLRMFKL